MAGQLNGPDAEPARCAGDQHLPARLDLSEIAQKGQSRLSAEGRGGGLIIADRGRLFHNRRILRHRDVFGIGAEPHRKAEHFIAALEARHVFAPRHHAAGKFGAEHILLRPEKPGHGAAGKPEYSREFRCAEAPVGGVHRSGEHLHQNFIVFRFRPRDFANFNNVRGAISIIPSCFHRYLPYPSRPPSGAPLDRDIAMR